MARDRSIWRQELVAEISREVHRRGWKVDVDGLVRTELALTLQTLVAPGEPAAGVWALLRGYRVHQLPPAADQALSVARWLLGELKSEDTWTETLADYLQIPEQARAFVIDDPNQPAHARTPGIASDRHDLYAAALRRLPPHQPVEIPAAEAGIAYQVSAAGMDETIVIPGELPEPVKLARHLLPDRPKRQRVRIKWSELLVFAESLDEEDRAAGREGQHWHRRLKDVRVRLRGKDGRFRRTQQLDLAQVHHIVGMVGAGKTTVMDLVAMWAARSGHTVTIVVADVVSALRRVELFNRYGCPAAPVLGASSRSRHVQQLHRPGTQPVDGVTAMANPLLDWASTACALSVHRATPGPWDVDDAPCTGLKRTTVGPRGGQSLVRHVCPLWGGCQRHRGSRALVDAKIWVATPAGLVYTYVPAPVVDYDLRYLEMAWHRSDLIVVDEADQVQAQLDGIFSPSQTLAGQGDDAWLDLIGTEKDRQLRLLGRGPIVQRKVARWNLLVDNAGTLVSRIYSMLGTHPHLRAWIGDGYFNEWTLSVRLATSFATKPVTTHRRDDEPAGRIDADLAQSWRASFAKWALRPTDPRTPCGDTRADELRRLCSETGYSDDTAITQALRAWLLARDDLHLPADPGDRDQLVLRLQFTLLVGMLARLVSQITGSWSDVEAPLRMRGHGSSLVHRPPVEYTAVVPDSPMGNLIGFQYQHDDARPDRLGSLRFFRCAGIGRWLLLNLANLYVDADTAPPGVLLLSATSWAGTSPRYDLQVEVTGLLEASHKELAGIHASRLHYSPQRYDSNHLIRVSGRNGADRTAALHAMTFALARTRDDGLGGPQPSVLERQRDALPPNRRRILLVIGSYRESEDVETALLKTRPEWDGQIVRLVPDDATFTHHWAGRTLARGSIHELRHTNAWILIAPMLSIERGHNILNSDNVAALGAVFFLVRPHPRPDDIAYHVQDINRWGVRQIRDHLPAANTAVPSMPPNAPLHVRTRAFINIARGRWRRALANPLMLSAMSDDEERSAFMWTQLVTVWQIIGRLVRGGQAAEVHFCDAAFDPSHPDSLLAGMRQVLTSAMADPATAELATTLYAPLQKALATLLESDHAL